MSTLGERQMVMDILDVYRSYPCLWDRRDKSYTVRKLKKGAYEVLLTVMRQWDETADLESLKKKIENMRTTAKREYKKVQLSRLESNSPQEVYEPVLYYYNKIKFVFDEEDGGADTDNGNCSESDANTIYLENMELVQRQKYKKRAREESVEEQQFAEAIITEQDDQTSCFDKTDMALLQRKINHNKKRVSENSTEEQQFAETIMTEQDETSCFGKTIGYQLKDLEETQRFIAENLISNAIFQARLGKLNPDSHIVL